MVDIFHFHSPIFSQLQSPPKIRSSTSAIFYLIFRPNLFVKSSLQSPLTLPSSISQQFSTSLFLRIADPTTYIKSIFPTSVVYPIQAASRNQ